MMVCSVNNLNNLNSTYEDKKLFIKIQLMYYLNLLFQKD